MATKKPTGFEMPDQFRQMAEGNVKQAQQAFDEMMSAMQKAVTTVESSASTVQTGALDFNKKALGYAEENVAKAFEYATKSLQVTDMQDLMQLQNEFLRTQMTALGEQARDLSDAVTKTATEATKSSDK
ncbi:phasin [Rhodobium orientis]|uniref:Phasin n=1 Tax=Rhodobium orientis TaxID=34017 RepID=A0A327JM40_9HYPH|nr:phasin family protein [Rhodobium orientis]MBB4304110.1 phasin [Rhodobium orientis]MBK5948619.1 phasin [Rhodobium orientis]RAI24291.1 phasin [Rhodobium orientis]